MDRKELKELLPIMHAYVDGRIIQFKKKEDDDWIDLLEGGIVISPGYDYRIKPEPKYRPFKTQEECWQEMHKHPDFGWVKSIQYGDFSCINDFNHQGDIFRINISNVSMVMEYVFSNYTFTDGTPFGIKEE